jgi:hypothetical protein
LVGGSQNFTSYLNLLAASGSAHDAVDAFFVDAGAGAEFESAVNDQGDPVDPEAALLQAISDRRTQESNAEGYETDVSNATTALGDFLSATNTTFGTSYADSDDIGAEITALNTLLNGDDADNAADNITGFFDIHNGTDERAIDDLADLNGQIDNSIVIRDIAAVDDTAHTVSLTQAEVDRLGEGSVQIEATQTDAVGNEHEGVAATNSFVIDTVNPEVTIADDQSGIAFDGANTVEYTLSFSEAVQSVTEGDLTVSGAESFSVAHTADTSTATVTVTVADDSMENVSITVNDSIVDIAGNPLIEAVDNLQTVDTVNPSTVGAPAVSDVLVTDADGATTLTVSFSFDEAMDQGIAPDVTFDPAVASTLTSQTGRWTDAQTYVVEAVVADAGVDADAVTIDISGAHDVAGNLQVDHTVTVGLEVDTLNPDSSTLSIEVADSDQTDGDAATSFTVSTSDLDPGTIHVDMRGSEYTELTSIKSSYISDVNTAIAGLEAAESQAAGLEAALSGAEGDVDAFFGTDGAGDGYADSAAIGAEASRVEGLGADFDGLEAEVVSAQGHVDAFFGT